MDLKRTIKCSNCGNEASMQLSTEVELKELLISGKCTKCGSAMQITYSLVDASTQSQQQSTYSSTSSSNPLPNLDESIFGSGSAEIESDTLKDLMED